MRNLGRRIPVRVRHYWKLLAGCVAVLAVLTVVVSTVRVQPYVTSRSDDAADVVTQDIAGTVDLFDSSVAHTVEVRFADDDYQRMLDAFWKDGEKEYVEADLVVDGTTVPSVGIRLKGNSTLMGLTRNGQARQNARPGGGMRGGGPREGAAPRTAPSGAPQPGAEPGPAAGQPPGGPAMGGFGGSSLKAEEPEDLPWLIRFDEFVDGRRYQGHREVAVRVSGMGGGSTVLNEAVSLDVLAASGEVSQGFAYTSFAVNDRPVTARLLVEHPDENFADDAGGSGVLYKSLASGQFTDQGDDPTDYQDDFKQITMTGSQDLQPVIDLVKWVNSASDADFDAHLGDHVDVPSFARYAAWQNLLLNFDDMSGPGRNYYLWYDLDTKKFSVIGWDYNLTFSGDAGQGPHEQGRMGGGGPTEAEMPDGFEPPEGFQPPEGFPAPGGGDGAQGARGGFGGHKLKERFLASSTYQKVYEDAYRELYRKVYAGGAAQQALQRITQVLSTVDGYDAQATATDAERLKTTIEQRTTALAANEVVKN